MAGDYGWTRSLPARRSASLCRSQKRGTMVESILVALIDDDEGVLDALQHYLARQRIETSCFLSANDFLNTSDDGKQFDCIVSDVRMPGLSGLDLTKHICDRPHPRPVILITGHGDIDMAVAAMKIGAFDFIEKPFDEARLLASIQYAAEQKRRGESVTAELEELQSRFNSLSNRSE